MTGRRDAGLVALATALALLVAALPAPQGLSVEGQYALATAAFAGTLWVSGGLPLSVTGLLVPVWLVALGVVSEFEAALSGFADPVIFLFLGTFVLADALSRHGVDRRVALALVATVGTSPRRLVLGVMLATALLSMVVSNTATAAMMVPVALGLVREVEGAGADAVGVADPAPAPSTDADAGDAAETPPSSLRTATLLGVAYAASIGGLGTLVGTPPNAIVVAALDAQLGVSVTFLEWAALGLPLVAVTLPLAWLLLVRLHPPSSGGSNASTPSVSTTDRPPLGPGGRRAASVFVAVAVLWLLGGVGFLFENVLPGPLYVTLFGGPGPSLLGAGDHQGVLYFAVVAVLAVPALVLLGVSDADDVAGIDWNTLLLFGGGISLADALGSTGATEWLAGAVFDTLAGVPLFALLFAVVVLTVLLSELASNTATVAVLAPVLVAIGVARGPAYGLAPEVAGATLAVASAVAASYGFALPVATPPNAVVFGTGAVTRREMLRAGLLLDALMAVVTTTLLYGLFAAGLTFVT